MSEITIDTASVEKANSEDLVSIIIIHKDKPQYLNICIQSIAVNSINNKYEIIVVDNGSTSKDAIDFLDSLESDNTCKVIKNEENLWWSKAANQGAKAADKSSKFLIFLHADVVILSQAWIDLMTNISEIQDSGVVGTSLYSYSDVNGRQKYDFVEEWCMLVTRECWQDCGPFCEELPLIGSPFLFTIKCVIADYKPQVTNNKIVHHYSVFGVDNNEFARFAEIARSKMPTLLRDVQNKTKKRVKT